MPDRPGADVADAAAQRAADVIGRTAAPVTAAMLSAALTAVGVTKGSLIIVHSSLSRLGWVAGGPHAVVNALLQHVGTAGTIVMPAFSSDLSDPAGWVNPPVPESWWQTIRDERPAYDPRLTPTTNVGAVVECFRHVPEAVRSDHPADSFVAVGPLAETIVHPHPLTPAFGEGSPLARLYDYGATIVLLGVGHGNNTSLHLAEGRAGCAQRTTSYGAPMSVDGARRWVEFVDLDYDSSDFEAIGEAFAATGRQRTAALGNGAVLGCSMREAVDFAAQWMTQNRPAGS